MGTQFFWFYDLLILAILLAVTFRCYKRGFVSVIVGFVAIAVSFFVALYTSDTVTNIIYDNFIDDQVTEYINNGIDDLGGDNALLKLSEADTSQILINGMSISELNTELDSAGKITLDLSSVDFSKTGISDIDLSFFGINDEFDFSKINIGKVNIMPSELDKHDIGTVVLAKTLSHTMKSETGYGNLVSIAENISEIAPFLNGGSSNEDYVSGLICTVIETSSDDIAASMMESFVKPLIISPLHAVVFILIFTVCAVLLSIIARCLKIVNRIPVIGKINSFFGAVVGILEGVIIIVIVCVVIHIIISLTGNTIILLNTVTIDSTLIFKYIYNLEILNLML